MFGLEFYCQVIRLTSHAPTRLKAIHRLIELCLRVPENNLRNPETVKLNNWNYLADQLANLEEHTLLAYQLLLTDIKGRMKSLNITEPDLIHLTILNKSNHSRTILTLPRYTSLWAMRAAIG